MFNDIQIRFPRDENSKYDPVSGTVGDTEYKSTYKYAQESRVCLGVAKTTLTDGTTVGRKARVFDYSRKKIVSIAEYDKRRNDEINRVKSLPSTSSNWVKHNCPKKSNDCAIYEEDLLVRIPNVGKMTIDKLKSAGVKHVNQIQNLPSERATELAQKNGLSLTVLASACRWADTTKLDSFPDNRRSKGLMRTPSA